MEIGKVEDRLQSLNFQRISQSARIDATANVRRNTPLTWPVWNALAIDANLNLDDETFRQNLLGLLEANNPELHLHSMKINSGDAKIALAELASYPDITLGINYIQTGSALNAMTPDNGKDPWALTLSFNLPIWKKKNKALRNQAEFHKDALEKNKKGRANILGAELLGHIANLQDSIRRMERYGEELLKKAEQAVEISRISYEGGRTEILEVIDSKRTLLDMQLLFWRAAADAWENKIRIEALINQPLF